MSLKDFLDKHQSSINTTGHVLSYLQNEKIKKNQRQLAALDAISLDLLNQQNELRKKETDKLEKIEKLMDQREKEKREQELKEKLKTEILQLGPETKSLLSKVQKSDLNKLMKNLMLKHIDLNIKKMNQHKEIVNDINFFDYLFELKEKKDELGEIDESLIKSFSDELATLLVDFQNLVLGAELISKSKKDILTEQSDGTKRFLKKLKTNINDELKKVESLNKLLGNLNQIKSLNENFVIAGDTHDLIEYPIPISFEEGEYLFDLINEIQKDPVLFVNTVDKKVDEVLSVFVDTSNSIIDKMLSIANKDFKEIEADDLNFLFNQSDKELILVAKEKVDEKLSNLSSKLKHDQNFIETIPIDNNAWGDLVQKTSLSSNERKAKKKLAYIKEKFFSDNIYKTKITKDCIDNTSFQSISNAGDLHAHAIVFYIMGFLLFIISIATAVFLLGYAIMAVFVVVGLFTMNKSDKVFFEGLNSIKSELLSEIDESLRKISAIKKRLNQ